MLHPFVVAIVMTACLVRTYPLLGLPRAISEQQSLLKTLTLFVKFGYKHSIPPYIKITGADPDGFFDQVDCGTVDGRVVDW